MKTTHKPQDSVMKFHKKTDYELRLFLEREIKEIKEAHALEIKSLEDRNKELNRENNKLKTKLGSINGCFNFKVYADTFEAIHREYSAMKTSGNFEMTKFNRLNIQLNKLYDNQSKRINSYIKNNNLGDELSK